MGFPHRFIELAGEINIGMPYHVLDSVAKALNQNKKSSRTILTTIFNALCASTAGSGHAKQHSRDRQPQNLMLLRAG